MHSSRNCFLGVLCVVVSTITCFAGVPNDPADRAKIVGQPASLEAAPAAVMLSGPRSAQQLVISGRYADGSVRDLTPFVSWKLEQPEIATSTDGFLRGKKDGLTNIFVEAGGKSLKIPVTVQDIGKSEPVSFRHQVIASFNVGGCNAGACHGTPSG
jgi:hypothetical protein